MYIMNSYLDHPQQDHGESNNEDLCVGSWTGIDAPEVTKWTSAECSEYTPFLSESVNQEQVPTPNICLPISTADSLHHEEQSGLDLLQVSTSDLSTCFLQSAELHDSNLIVAIDNTFEALIEAAEVINSDNGVNHSCTENISFHRESKDPNIDGEAKEQEMPPSSAQISSSMFAPTELWLRSSPSTSLNDSSEPTTIHKLNEQQKCISQIEEPETFFNSILAFFDEKKEFTDNLEEARFEGSEEKEAAMVYQDYGEGYEQKIGEEVFLETLRIPINSTMQYAMSEIEISEPEDEKTSSEEEERSSNDDDMNKDTSFEDTIPQVTTVSLASDKLKTRHNCPDYKCKKTFSTSGHAKRHARLHKAYRKYGCPFSGCLTTFTRRDNCRQHQYSRHGEILEPQLLAQVNKIYSSS